MSRLIRKTAKTVGSSPGTLVHVGERKSDDVHLSLMHYGADSLVERTYGRETIYDEMLSEIGNELYQEALEQAQIEPYDQARFEIVQLEPLILKRGSASPISMLGFSSFVDSGLGAGEISGFDSGRMGLRSSSRVGTSPRESMERDNSRTDKMMHTKTTTVL